MKRLLKLVVLFCLCHMEVYVRAETQGDELKHVSVPEACWETTSTCAISALSKIRLTLGGSTLELAPGAMIRRNSFDSVNVLEGEVWVSTSSEALQFEFPHGKLQVSPQSKLKVERLDKGVALQVLKGLASMTPLEKKDGINFPAGFKALLEWVNAQGEVQVNLPQSLSMTEWVSLFHDFHRDLPPAQAKKQLQQDLKVWRQAVETATKIQSDYATRKIAEANQAEEKARQAKVRKQQEQKVLREMYLKKLYN